MNRGKKITILKWVFLVAVIVVAVSIFLNREWLYDFYRGKTYQPSSEMISIRNSLNLTSRGEFLFNASQPELNNRDEFNGYCRGSGNEIAILGCYTNGNIYVYNITDKELDGIRELTTAHELLHAVYDRMPEADKEELSVSLEKVYQENLGIFKEDLDTYPENERAEELYVRAGTEVKKLPDDLEKHYAEIFKDQDKVVGFYDKYIKVFKQLETELDQLEQEMKAIAANVEKKTIEYEANVNQLNSEIGEFNVCADTMGCFESEQEFNIRRNELVIRQNALDAVYDEINAMINQYNEKVELYNRDVLRTEKLNEMINSNTKPKNI